MTELPSNEPSLQTNTNMQDTALAPKTGLDQEVSFDTSDTNLFETTNSGDLTIDSVTGNSQPTSSNSNKENIPLDSSKLIQIKREQLQTLQNHCEELVDSLGFDRSCDVEQVAESIVKSHIKQLKRYNELKDAALNLVGLIADQKQVRVCDILEEMGVVDDE